MAHLKEQNEVFLEPIAHIRSPYAEKFGVPRQGNLAPSVESVIEFTPAYRNPDCLRGIEQFSHLWLIWGFDRNGTEWSPTVRPPRLGGNVRLGVFATRSPFRPNGLGLSVVRLLAVEADGNLRVSGADMVDGTPIYDVKPYIPYADSLPEATAGFTEKVWEPLTVRWDCPQPPNATPRWCAALEETLSLDPRPAYHDDPQRCYHLIFSPCEVSFRVEEGTVHILSHRPHRP